MNKVTHGIRKNEAKRREDLMSAFTDQPPFGGSGFEKGRGVGIPPFLTPKP
jgi:hypothetical protein